jgi:hypothetical protein
MSVCQMCCGCESVARVYTTSVISDLLKKYVKTYTELPLRLILQSLCEPCSSELGQQRLHVVHI